MSVTVQLIHFGCSNSTDAG